MLNTRFHLFIRTLSGDVTVLIAIIATIWGLVAVTSNVPKFTAPVTPRPYNTPKTKDDVRIQNNQLQI